MSDKVKILLLIKALEEAIKDYDKRKMTYGWHDLQINMFKEVLKQVKK